MRRLEIQDVETFQAAVEDEIFRYPEGRYYHRLHVVLHVLKGASCYEAARIYGHSPRTVQYWVHRLMARGLEGLREEERPGRPARLSSSQQEILKEHLCRSPREFGYDRNIWDGLLLCHHIERHFSIHLGVRQCQYFFHRLGFSLQRPRRKAAEADPEKQERFKKT